MSNILKTFLEELIDEEILLETDIENIKKLNEMKNTLENMSESNYLRISEIYESICNVKIDFYTEIGRELVKRILKS